MPGLSTLDYPSVFYIIKNYTTFNGHMNVDLCNGRLLNALHALAIDNDDHAIIFNGMIA